MRRWGVLACVGGLVFVAGCRDRLPPGWDAAAARAFQQAVDEEMGGPVTPLTAIEAHYVAAGDALRLGLAADGRTVTTAPAPDAEPQIALRVDDEGLHCTRGCPGDEMITDATRAPLGSVVLHIGPQPGAGGRVVVHDPDAAARTRFEGLHWFPVDPAFIVPAKLERVSEPERVELTTSRGLAKPFWRVGHLELELHGHEYRLAAYGAAEGQGPFVVPFTDETTGGASYAVGRYLRVAIGEGDVVAVDFNRATNPWCAYSPHYNCPIPPKDNVVSTAVEAGEKAWHD